MKILYCSRFGVRNSDAHYVSRATERLGHEVVRVEEANLTTERLIAIVQKVKPDLFLSHKLTLAGHVWPDDAEHVARVLDAIRPHAGHTVVWQFDLLNANFSPERFYWATIVSEHVDLFATTDGSVVSKISNAMWLPCGIPDDGDESVPWDVEPKGDVLFLGAVYDRRADLVSAFHEAFGDRFHIINDAFCEDITYAVRSHRLNIGPHYPRADHYWSDRIYRTVGNGGLLATPSENGLTADGWQAGVHYIGLGFDPHEMVRACKDWLSNPKRCEIVRRAGYDHAQKHCTYESRVTRLLSELHAKERTP